MNDKGSTSAVILGILLFISVLFIGTGLFIEFTLKNLRLSTERDRQKEALVKEAERAVQLLLSDPTSFADSALDPVWEHLQNYGQDEVTISIQDVSSYLGINWVRKEILQKMDVLKHGRTAQEFQQFREDSGIHLNVVTAFLDFLEKEQIDGLFTAYNYFNINICDEFTLRKLYFVRSSDLGKAEVFHTKIQQIRMEKKQIDRKDLRAFLGEDHYRLLFPIVNAEPVMNIHFVPKSILQVLFSHYGVSVEKTEVFLALRETSEWTNEELSELLGEKYSDTLLHHYFGTTTWFWRIRVNKGEQELVWIIARIPKEKEGEDAEFRLVEERFSI